MTLNSKQLHNLPVYTRSGQHLGFVVGFEIELAGQSIAQYLVKPRQGIAGLFEQELIIARQQVVSLSAEKLVVEDAFVRQPAAEAADVSLKTSLPAENS